MQYLAQNIGPACWAVVLALAGSAVAGPPELAPGMAAGPARPGDACRIEYRVQWEGAPDEWLVMPPELPEPGWAERGRVVLRAVSEGGEQTVTVEVTFTPIEEGDFEWPAVAIPVAAPPESGRLLDAEPALWLDADAVSVSVRPGPPAAWLAGAAAVLLAAAVAAAWVLVRRKRSGQAQAEAPPPYERARMRLHEARRRRLDGDWYGFYLELEGAMQELAPAGGGLTERFARRAQEAGYGGVRPLDDEMDGAMRDAERALTDWRRGSGAVEKEQKA